MSLRTFRAAAFLSPFLDGMLSLSQVTRSKGYEARNT